MLLQNIEIEYKCLVTENEYRRLLKHYENNYQETKQNNIYYADQQRNIDKKQAVLRQRLLDDHSILGFKIRLDHELLEYEIPGTTFDNPEFLALLATYDIQPPFDTIGELLTIRRLVDLPNAELCLDENHYHNAVDYEIEYELKNTDDDLTVFIDLLKKVDIIYQPNHLSKYQRLLQSLNKN